MLAAGLLVTVNSDDPSYFGGYVEDNFQGLRRALGLTDGQLERLARNSFLASFVDDARRGELLAELDAVAAAEGLSAS
jgi:adenosine deaminase